MKPIKLYPLSSMDYQDLYLVYKGTDLPDIDFNTFVRIMEAERRTGYVIRSGDGETVGCVGFGDYRPPLDVTLHAFVSPGYLGEWLSDDVAQTIADYAFNGLKVGRVSAFIPAGEVGRARSVMNRLGFKHEGTMRRVLMDSAGNAIDCEVWGLLKEDFNWRE